MVLGQAGQGVGTSAGHGASPVTFRHNFLVNGVIINFKRITAF